MTIMLLLLYGLCAWGAACNLPAWARLVHQRLNGERPPVAEDEYLHIRMAVLASALGLLGGTTDRVRGYLVEHTMLTVPSGVTVGSVALLLLGEALFLRAAAIKACKRGQAPWAWRAFWAGALAWTGYVILAG